MRIRQLEKSAPNQRAERRLRGRQVAAQKRQRRLGQDRLRDVERRQALWLLPYMTERISPRRHRFYFFARALS